MPIQAVLWWRWALWCLRIIVFYWSAGARPHLKIYGPFPAGVWKLAKRFRKRPKETGVKIHAGKPIYTFDVIDRDADGKIRFHYVIVDLAADYVSGEPAAGDDAAEARWVSAHEVNALEVSRPTLNLLKSRFGFGR